MENNEFLLNEIQKLREEIADLKDYIEKLNKINETLRKDFSNKIIIHIVCSRFSSSVAGIEAKPRMGQRPHGERSSPMLPFAYPLTPNDVETFCDFPAFFLMSW